MNPTSPLRLLLWLKWTLIWRGYRRNKLKALSTILSVLILVPLSIVIAYGVHFLVSLHPWSAPLVARDALAIIYLIWVLTPLLGIQFNDSFDLTKLFVYPLSYRQIFFGSVLGSLIDLPVLLTLPTFCVLLTAFSTSPGAWVVNILLLVLFLFHTLALGQAITLTLIGFLRSRRFRDITVVLLPLISIVYYVGQRVFFSHFVANSSLEGVLDGPIWRALGWLPPGWAAHGLSGARNGDWLTALLQIGLLALAALGALWVAATSLRNLYLGDRGPLTARAGQPLSEKRLTQGLAPTPDVSLRVGMLPRGRPIPLTNVLTQFAPPDVAAVADKEFLYLWREPQYKVMALNAVYSLVVLVMAILFPSLSRSNPGQTIFLLGDWFLFGLSGTLLMVTIPLLFNIWAGEGAAITVLFSFPTRRRALLLGKNLAHASVLLVLNFLGLTLAAGLTHHWGGLPLVLVWTLAAAPVLLAAGNLVSIRFPHRMLVRGQRWTRGGIAAAGGDGSGCAYAFLYMIAYLTTFLALLPALAAVILPRLLGWSPLVYALSLPLALAYAVILYVILLGQAETWLMAREPEIAQRIVPAD
jgi:hypothetical protein